MDESAKVVPENCQENRSHPLISVAICTYNRADRLILALEALCQQSLESQFFEVLVVDNASTDETQKVCTDYQEQLSNLRYIYEPVQGLSKARNTALEQARGEYISYLDDDAIPCQTWVEEIRNTFQTAKPTPVGVGGPIYPLWEMGQPEWMQEEMNFLFTILDYGDEPHWLKFPRFPFGANMSYQRQVLCQVGGFHENLGRKGGSLLSCEEYLLNKTLTRQGGRFYYNPQASVQHWIPKERSRSEWVIRRSYWQGRSEAVVDQLVGKSWKRQRWDSLWKFWHPQRILNSALGAEKVHVLARAWLSRSWGYFFHVWFRHSLSVEISNGFKYPNQKSFRVAPDQQPSESSSGA